MKLHFLGTGAGLPSKRRNVTALGLELYDERGTWWLFDCGEGTQHQLLQSPLKLSRLESIFVTHLHGDHIYGLPGLLTSRGFQTERPLTLFGPAGIREFVETSLSVSQAHLPYPLDIRQVSQETVFECGNFTVEAVELAHGVQSFGYRMTEPPRPGRLKAEKLQALGVPAGPIYAQIKAGYTVTLSDGTLLNPQDFVEPSVPGRTIAIAGDSRPCDGTFTLAKQADVLVHEATFAQSDQLIAHEYFHTTTGQIAQIAKDAGLRNLILTHLSQRYSDEELVDLLAEAQAIFPETQMAKDFAIFAISKVSDHWPSVVVIRLEENAL